MMKEKKLALAWLVGFVVMFVIAYAWHMLIMGSFYDIHFADVLRLEDDVMVPFFISAYVVLGIIMAYAYPIGYSGGSPLAEGFRFGILVGLLWVFPHSLIQYATETVNATGVFVDAAWHIVEQGIGGIAIGMIYGAKPSHE